MAEIYQVYTVPLNTDIKPLQGCQVCLLLCLFVFITHDVLHKKLSLLAYGNSEGTDQSAHSTVGSGPSMSFTGKLNSVEFIEE